MIVYRGSDALAPYQRERLLSRVKNHIPQVSSIAARYIYFVDVAAASEQEKQLLGDLLAASEFVETSDQPPRLFVVPRLGTISPWSSKATDIALNCGLQNVQRIERGIEYSFAGVSLDAETSEVVSAFIHDRMVENVLLTQPTREQLFAVLDAQPLQTVPVSSSGVSALSALNTSLGLALSEDEIQYLVDRFVALGRDPSDAELMMFSLINSEHCRHKVFNASWVVDSEPADASLFQMIRNTYKQNSAGIKSAYHDNGAVLAGRRGSFFFPNEEQVYTAYDDFVDLVIKVETHNHPTAIAPVPGAATGSGGEIRDEGATGRGAKPKAGLVGFSVSDLLIPGHEYPWEVRYGKPEQMVSALEVMVDGPLGGAAFNNEFGRPNLLGYFRSFQADVQDRVWGFHKPIMIAGGTGAITPENVQKEKIQAGDALIVLGGPAMLIGLGGGAASSVEAGSQSAELDFASVQRHNPEMQRRCQEVINACWSLGQNNPIVSIHDVGAGGLSNALPELVHDSDLGADIELREIFNADMGMSPMQLWSNEAQERYVLALRPDDVARFTQICERERCPHVVVGTATEQANLLVRDSLLGEDVVAMPLDVLFGKPPKMVRSFDSVEIQAKPFDTTDLALDDAVERVLSHPTVASKSFLITIGDRTVGGMTARDQMVGPWQVPVADVAVTHNSFTGHAGEAMAMGERSPVAILNPAASGRLAIGEVITNMLSANVASLSDIKLSANWMAAVDAEGQNQALFETVRAVGESFCPDLGITIPVGKDSLSMQTSWQDAETDESKSVTSPVSLVATGFASVADVRETYTPLLTTEGDTVLVLIPVGTSAAGSVNALGGSILAQTFGELGDKVPDVQSEALKRFFDLITGLKNNGTVLAYHDRSDGGLLATLCEMMFTSRVGLSVDLSSDDIFGALFSEGLGAVIQVRAEDLASVSSQIPEAMVVAKVVDGDQFTITNNGEKVFESSRVALQKLWSGNSFQIQRLRDNPVCADAEFANLEQDDPGLSPFVPFSVQPRVDLAASSLSKRKVSERKVAILREQGVNGHVEMAAAFVAAGFTSVDVHMSDLRSGSVQLSDFVGLVACGGFSYGDVLGAGAGWAKSILFDASLRQQFAEFFAREDTFSLGVCNGCQMFSLLRELIPGAEGWPRFVRNASQQFEARVTTFEITDSPSIFFQGMEGSRLLVPTAHGEGQVDFGDADPSAALVTGRYVDNHGAATDQYPHNPNGSVGGMNAFTSADGRATILMPHPERVFRSSQFSWHTPLAGDESPWLQMFHNAYAWSSGFVSE